MTKLVKLGIGVGLIFAGLSDAVQAGSIFDSIWSTGQSGAQIELYDRNQRQLEQQRRPEKERPGHTDMKNYSKPATPKRQRSILDKPSG